MYHERSSGGSRLFDLRIRKMNIMIARGKSVINSSGVTEKEQKFTLQTALQSR